MLMWRQDRVAVAVVTGASNGLGRALSVEFTRRGIAVVGFGRSAPDLETTAQLAGTTLFTPMTVDVSDSTAVNRAFAELSSSIGPPDILVNNAAVHPRKDITGETAEEFMKCVSINLGGAVNCSYAALQTMIPSGTGRIVNVGSFADLAPLSGAGAYCVSKGALRIFSNTLVADLGDRFPGILITTWMPGILATRMGLPDGLDPALAAHWGVELALCQEPTINGAMFERDLQMARPRSMKRRLLDKLLRHDTRLLRLTSPAPA